MSIMIESHLRRLYTVLPPCLGFSHNLMLHHRHPGPATCAQSDTWLRAFRTPGRVLLREQSVGDVIDFNQNETLQILQQELPSVT